MPKVFSLRLPDDVYTQIKDAAGQECRSINETIEYAVRRYLAALAEAGPLKVQR